LNYLSRVHDGDTLKELENEGLIKRESFAEIPPRVEYTLTKDGEDLRKAIVPMLRWASMRNDVNKEKCVPIYQKIPAHKVKSTTFIKEKTKA